MVYLARNISGKYSILLKHQVKPGGVIDLEAVFEGFCKPKKCSKAEPARNSEFTKEQFEEFLEWVTEKADPREWALEFGGEVQSGAKNRGVSGLPSPTKRKKTHVLATRTSQRKADSSELTPKQIALLPFGDATKKTLSDCSDIRKLKAALKMAKNLAGQERVRALLEDRLQELASEGII